jgi:hypothetical protein
MSEAHRIADNLDTEFVSGRVSNHTARKAAAELRRLAGVEAELQQAREERTALLVNEQNLREELAALRASLSKPVAYSMTSNGGHTGNLYEDLEHAQERKAFMDQEWPDLVRDIVPLFAIKDTK